MVRCINVAIIPARSGSKRIPDKNIRDFFGKPMLAYAIEKALSSAIFDEVVVSTDSEKIAQIALKSGASVPFLRPSRLADDFSTTSEVIAHAIGEISKTSDIKSVCCIYPCVPLMRVEDLKEGFRIFESGKYEFVISATKYSYSPFRAFIKEGEGLAMLHPEYLNTRSQDLIPVYHDAAQFYFGKPEAFLEGRSIFDSKSAFVEIPQKFVQDIDTLEDWEMALLKFRALRGFEGK